jgi:hypothetical protein
MRSLSGDYILRTCGFKSVVKDEDFTRFRVILTFDTMR